MTLPRDSLSKMNKGLYRYGIEPTVVTGTFTIGAAAAFYETQQGQGAIVARTGAGAYTITLADTDVVDVYSAIFTVQDTAGAFTDLYARAEDIAVTAGVATIDCECYATAVATDILTANNLLCHYEIVYTRAWQAQPDTRAVGYYHHVTDTVMIAGRAVVGAVGAVPVADQHGEGFVLTRTGAGIFLLTFTDAFNGFLGGKVNCGHASAVGGDLSCNFGPFAAGAAGAATVNIFTNAVAVATDPAALGSINFTCLLNSEATGA